MNIRRWLRTLSMVAVMVGLLFVPGRAQLPESLADVGQTLRLVAPPFVRTAYAQENPTAFDLGAYLDQEAGISAYYKSPDAITLSQVRGQFRTIETETADYIIGSVAVPNYSEHFDVHVYVNSTGWILAYYLRSNPASKIIDLNARSITTTKLKTVVSVIANAAGAPLSDVTYYDFQYPNATNFLLVADYNDFTIQMPSSYAYFERGWGMINIGGNDAYFWVNGIRPSATYGAWPIYYGMITPDQLMPDTTNTVSTTDFGVLIVIYRVP